MTSPAGESNLHDMLKSAADMLERSHRRLEERMAQLLTTLDALAEGASEGAVDAQAVLADVLRFLQRSAKNHIGDEEDSVFPRLGADAAPLIARLRREHVEQDDLAQRLIAQLERLQAGLDDDAVHAARELASELDGGYRRHTALEDEQLLPLVLALDSDDLATIAAEMQARRGKAGTSEGHDHRAGHEAHREDGGGRGGGGGGSDGGGARGGGGGGGGGGGRGGGGGGRGGGGGGGRGGGRGGGGGGGRGGGGSE